MFARVEVAPDKRNKFLVAILSCLVVGPKPGHARFCKVFWITKMEVAPCGWLRSQWTIKQWLPLLSENNNEVSL